MNNRTISFNVSDLGAWICALIAVGLVTYDIVQEPGSDDRAAFVGMLFMGVGVMLQVRSWLCLIIERERRAFELGRDYGAGQTTPIRRTPSRN